MFKTKKNLLSVAVVVATFGLTACGGSSSNPAPPPPPPPAPPANSAPTDITLSASSVTENDLGAIVGTLSATDADASDTFTFAVDDGRFEIDGADLKLKAESALNFENEAEVTLSITVTDSESADYSKDITISVDDLLDYYDFVSKIDDTKSSVSYSGQVARQILINDLSKFIGAQLSDVADFDTNASFADREAVMETLNSYFDVSDYSVASQRTILTTTTPGAQTTLAEISGSSKNLVGKIAGKDVKGQHKDWTTEFEGWGVKGSTTPEELVRTFFNMLADNAQTQLNGTVRQDPFGNPITNISLTNDGRDLKQLIQKFLTMSVSFSQGVDDYLDDDEPGKGLLSSHDFPATDDPYTDLEHQFDEGFGYFGAARDYLDYSDDETAGKSGRDDWQGYHDTDADGSIDFNSEYNFGHSTNAAKRDRSATGIDLTKDAMTAFLQGRKLLNDTAGNALSDDQKVELYGYRDTAILAWEKAIAATVVHYINDVDDDLAKIATGEFSYADLTKHWSEMKGFALGLQFNEDSPLSDADFATVHTMFGDMPVLIGDVEVADYRAGLMSARDLMQEAYAFSPENAENW